MEQDKALDKKTWQQVHARINSEITLEEFKVMCEIHAKYYNQKYSEPNFCSCNNKEIKRWIKQVNEVFKK